MDPGISRHTLPDQIVPDINFHISCLIFFFSEICQELQKDDEEWCYFMRYGKPRRNRSVPNESTKDLEREAAIARRAQIWKFVNATLSCIGIWSFIFIFVILFLIFHQIDNRPFFSIFYFGSWATNNHSKIPSPSRLNSNSTISFS